MKCLHYMPVPSPIYNHVVLDVVTQNSLEFEHDFIIKYKDGLESDVLKKKNILINPNYGVNELNRDCKYYDYVFVHGLNFSYFEMCKLRKTLLKKIIWCVWGHDLYKDRNCKLSLNIYQSLKSIMIVFLIKTIWIPKVKKFYAICHGFSYDQYKINELVGSKVETFNVAYGLGYDFSLIKGIKQHMNEKNRKKTKRVLLGHSAYSYLNHAKILKQLGKYRDNDFEVIIPLSYGDTNYREALIRQLKNYSLRIKILNRFLNPAEYLSLLSSIDIAIFDNQHQAALGNLCILLFLEKKVYLNAQGILYQGMRKEGINVFSTKDIGVEDFKSFIAKDFSSFQGAQWSEELLDNSIVTKKWLNLFKILKERLL